MTPSHFCVSPTSRLSNMITRMPLAANPSRNSLGQLVSCEPKPMMSRKGVPSFGPVSSYSILIPFALICGMSGGSRLSKKAADMLEPDRYQCVGKIMRHARHYHQLAAGNACRSVLTALDWHQGIVRAVKNKRRATDALQHLVAG